MPADERTVGRILTLIGARPNARRRPRPGDVTGDFDLWFDGGALRTRDGVQSYQLGDGTKITRAPGDRLALDIELPGGERIRVESV